MKNTRLKNRILLFTILLYFVIVMFALSSNVFAATEGDYEYEVTEEGTIIITKYKGNDSEIIVPANINGKNVTSIGQNAFAFCSSLTKIELLEGLETIGVNTFYGCSSLKEIKLPETIKNIRSGAFTNCESLTTIELPEGLESIEVNTFVNCKALKTMNLPEGLKSIGRSMFYNCSSLTEINLPEGLESIEEEAFRGCNSLTEINLPKELKSIGKSAFYNCNSLTKINLPEGLESIGATAFQYCSSLTTIELPEGLESIEGGMFFKCSRLRSIKLPESIKSIRKDAFDNCTLLKTIYGISGSYAETFAHENNYTFISLVDINNCKISEIVKQEYTGETLTPNITIKDENTELKNETDYEVAYTNNINVGTATLTIKGKGNYTGRITKTFEIVAKDLSKVTATVNTENKTHTGKAQTTSITLKDGSRALKEGTDYIVNYKNNINIGTATVEIVGKGNYTGKIVKNFAIIAKPTQPSKPSTENKYKLGDINKDNKIDTKDARLVLLAYVGKEKLTAEQKQLADVNKDGKVDTRDARQILLYYVGKIKNF